MRLLLALPLVFALSAAGCGTPRPIAAESSSMIDEPAPMVGTRSLGERFTLERGASALVDGQRLRFDAVLEDSRCPTNVTCVWEGKAVVSLTFTGEQAISEIRLEIPGYVTTETEPRESQRGTQSGYTFILLGLDPYPGTEEAEAADTPTATLVVTPVGG
ncbi:MAG: hypothetical protein HKN04_13680 [Rhodothermaceae bacterium]|nr:hypothetical protein [Rhodothermaceae bacterium]